VLSERFFALGLVLHFILHMLVHRVFFFFILLPFSLYFFSLIRIRMLFLELSRHVNIRILGPLRMRQIMNLGMSGSVLLHLLLDPIDMFRLDFLPLLSVEVQPIELLASSIGKGNASGFWTVVAAAATERWRVTSRTRRAHATLRGTSRMCAVSVVFGTATRTRVRPVLEESRSTALKHNIGVSVSSGNGDSRDDSQESDRQGDEGNAHIDREVVAKKKWVANEVI